MSGEKIDLSEIDLSSAPTLSAGADAVNPDIAAVFPEPLPESDPKQDFFAAAPSNSPNPPKTNTSPPGGPQEDDGGRDRRTGARPNGGVAPLSNRKKKKAGSKKGAGAATQASKVMAAAGQGDDDDEKGGDEKEELTGAAAKRAELRQKLRSKMAIQHDLGGRAKMLNQMGVTMNEIGEAARDEASGKPVSHSKQDAVLNKATNMFASTFKGMDPKQRTYLSRKTEEMSGMATNLMKKMLSGPGKDNQSETASKRKKGPKGVKSDTPAAPAATPSMSAAQAAVEAAAFSDSSEAKELDATLDPRAEDMVRAVHEKRVKPPRRKAAAATDDDDQDDRRKQLPIRPRVHRDQDAKSKSEVEPSKNQLKNKRKRQKLKEKLKQLKTIGPSAAAAAAVVAPAKPAAKPDDVPLLNPA